MTNRQIVSQIRSTNKLFADATLNDRSILAEARSALYVLLNQKTNKRKLWGTDTIFTTLDCIEMEPMTMNECCGHTGNDVSRSKLKLPAFLEGDYDYIIQGVYDVNGTQKIKYASLNRYLNLQKLDLKTKDVYYWIQNGHLVLSSPFIKQARVVAAVEGDVPYEFLFPECDCGPQSKRNPCKSRLDEDFKCPALLVGAVVTMVNQNLLTNYFKVPVDHTSDDKDDQINKG